MPTKSKSKKHASQPDKIARVLVKRLARLRKPVSPVQLALVNVELSAKLREFVDVYEKLSLLIIAQGKNGASAEGKKPSK